MYPDPHVRPLDRRRHSTDTTRACVVLPFSRKLQTFARSLLSLLLACALQPLSESLQCLSLDHLAEREGGPSSNIADAMAGRVR